MEQLFRYIMDKAIEEGATDIHFHKEDDFQVIFRIHTRLVTSLNTSIEDGIRLMNYIKYISKIDINQRFKPQTGTINYYQDDHYIPLRVSYIPLNHQDSLVIRILNNRKFLKITDLTPFKPVQEYLKQIIRYKQGLFIISGPTGVGKSTTLYSLLNTLVKDQQLNIITIEDPIEIISPQFTQIQINPQSGLDYQETLTQILRHDPDVIMIGEIRDKVSAKLMIDCALTGHLVLTTLHSSSCITSLKRLKQLDITLIDLEEVLIGIMSQKMFYSRLQNNLYCLYEFMDKKDLDAYFNSNLVHTFSFDDCLKLAYDHHYISIDTYPSI